MNYETVYPYLTAPLSPNASSPARSCASCLREFLQMSLYISHGDQLERMVYDLLEQALGLTCSGEYVR